MMLRLSLLSLLLVGHGVSGLLFTQAGKKPELRRFTEAHVGKDLKIRLDIMPEGESRPHMSITGMNIKLDGSPASLPHPKMPGADSMRDRHLSSGTLALDVLKEGSFVDMTGTKMAHVQNACWEMVWQKDYLAGYLLCGFDVPEDIRRNAAVLPKGDLFFSFTIWTRETLDRCQKKKRNIQETAFKFSKKRRVEEAKLRRTTNPLMKVLHYRNAFEAAENYRNSGIRHYSKVPEDEDVISMGDNLLVTKTGTMWTNKVTSNGFGRKKHLKLGVATIEPLSTEPDYSGLRP